MAFTESTVSIGIDLGGTSLRVGVFDGEMRLLGSRTLPTRVKDGPQAVVSDIASTISHLRDKVVAPQDQILGVGIGSPGPLNLRLGTLGSLPNFPGWDGFPLRDSLAEAATLPVFLECDANAAAIAEWKYGAGREEQVDSLAVITLGTGVGSGIILQGQVWHGMIGMGGELGHITLDRNGPECGCGGRGCLESYASANGLMRMAREAGQSQNASVDLRNLTRQAGGFTAKQVAELAVRGDSSAAKPFAQLGFFLGLGLACLTNILDLPLVLVGGGVATAWDLFAPTMFDTLRENSNVYRLGEPSQRHTMEVDHTFVRPALLGSGAGLLGAGLLPRLMTHADREQVILMETTV